MPLIISSSVVRAQFSASRLMRNVLMTVGQLARRIMAFQVPDGVLIIVAKLDLKLLRSVPKLYRRMILVSHWTLACP